MGERRPVGFDELPAHAQAAWLAGASSRETGRQALIAAAKEPVIAAPRDHFVVLVADLKGPLLKDGPCGALPPLVSRYPDGDSIDGIRLDRWGVEHGRHAHGPRTRAVFALPLVWDGAVVPDGWDRARRVAFRTHPAWGMLTVMDPDVQQVWMLARFLEKFGLCRVVVLDLVDGALVERAP